MLPLLLTLDAEVRSNSDMVMYTLAREAMMNMLLVLPFMLQDYDLLAAKVEKMPVNDCPIFH